MLPSDLVKPKAWGGAVYESEMFPVQIDIWL